MYPDAPTPEHLAGQVIHDLASEWMGPIRDLVTLHYKEMAQTGMADAAACHLAILAQTFLLDYAHHVLVDVNAHDDQATTVLEVDADQATSVLDAIRQAQTEGTTPEALDRAVKDALRRRFNSEGGTE